MRREKEKCEGREKREGRNAEGGMRRGEMRVLKVGAFKRKGQSVFEYVALISTAIILVTIVVILLRGSVFGPQEKEIANKSQEFYNLTKCLEPGYFNCTYCPDDKCPGGMQCNPDGSCTLTTTPSPSPTPSPSLPPKTSPFPSPSPEK